MSVTSSDIANLIEYLDYELPITGPVIIYPDIYLIGKSLKPDWNYFQYLLKVAAYINQDTLCICGNPLMSDIELHHSLISKKDVQGLSDNTFIHSPFNVVAIHHSCHEKATRQDCFKFLSGIYGEINVKNWYDEVNNKLKVRLRNL